MRKTTYFCDRCGKEITEARCHQMTIDEWLGIKEKNDMKKIKEARR